MSARGLLAGLLAKIPADTTGTNGNQMVSQFENFYHRGTDPDSCRDTELRRDFLELLYVLGDSYVYKINKSSLR